MTGSETICLLDFIPLIFHWSCIGIEKQWQYLLVVPTMGSQETYIKGVVNMMQVKGAAALASVIVTVVVNL